MSQGSSQVYLNGFKWRLFSQDHSSYSKCKKMGHLTKRFNRKQNVLLLLESIQRHKNVPGGRDAFKRLSLRGRR